MCGRRVCKEDDPANLPVQREPPVSQISVDLTFESTPRLRTRSVRNSIGVRLCHAMVSHEPEQDCFVNQMGPPICVRRFETFGGLDQEYEHMCCLLSLILPPLLSGCDAPPGKDTTAHQLLSCRHKPKLGDGRTRAGFPLGLTLIQETRKSLHNNLHVGHCPCTYCCCRVSALVLSVRTYDLSGFQLKTCCPFSGLPAVGNKIQG